MVDDLDDSVTALDELDALFGSGQCDQIKAVQRYLDPIRAKIHTVLAGLNALNDEKKGGAR